MGERQSYHCKPYSIYIHPEDVKELRSDVWNDDTVPARLKVGKKQYQIGIVYRGAHTRKFPRKSYRIECKNPATFFGAREFHLNAEYTDPSLIRNKLSFDFFHSLGVLAPESNHVLLKINGAVHGLYLHIESVDECFLKKRNLPDGSIFYASNDDANFSLLCPDNDELKTSLDQGYKRKYGNESHGRLLCEMIYKINTVPKADFSNEIVKYLDVRAYLMWLIGVVCTQNFDGFIQNYALYYNEKSNVFQIIPWDYDATWGRNINGKIMEHDYVPIEGYNTLTARILDVPEFRSQYRNELGKVLETKFTTEYLQSAILTMHNTIRPYIQFDTLRRNNIQKFDAEPDYILSFIKKRNDFLRSRLNDLRI